MLGALHSISHNGELLIGEKWMRGVANWLARRLIAFTWLLPVLPAREYFCILSLFFIQYAQ